MDIVVNDTRNNHSEVINGDIIKVDISYNKINLFFYLNTGYTVIIDKNKLLNFLVAEKLLGERM